MRLTFLHLFEGAPLGLLDEEPDEDDEGEIEDSEHEEGAPAEVLYRVRRSLREHEVEQPLRRCPDGHARLPDP